MDNPAVIARTPEIEINGLSSKKALVILLRLLGAKIIGIASAKITGPKNFDTHTSIANFPQYMKFFTKVKLLVTSALDKQRRSYLLPVNHRHKCS